MIKNSRTNATTKTKKHRRGRGSEGWLDCMNGMWCAIKVHEFWTTTTAITKRAMKMAVARHHNNK